MKKISIVIATYNFGNYLERAIQSVLSQDSDEYELIIVDGGSSDNSVDVIRKYEGRLAWWCSEHDSGQSEAFNKGFQHSTGEFLTWLNADDLLLPGTVSAVVKALAREPRADWATGNLIRFDQHTKKIIEAAWGPHWVPFVFQGNGFPLSIFGPTTFWRRKVYEEIGPLNEKYHYTMDSDYWRRLTVSGKKLIRVNHDCWAFRMHEQSKTAEFGSHFRSRERKELMHKETEESAAVTGYYVTKCGAIVRSIMRIFDGSYFKHLWRRFFWVGRNIEQCYGVQI